MTWLQISCPLIQEVKSQGWGICAAGQEGGKIVGRVVFRGQFLEARTRMLPVEARVPVISSCPMTMRVIMT